MVTKQKECYICGCTEDRACITEDGPCYWVFEDRKGHVCSACVVALPPDPKREKYPRDHVILKKLCKSCAGLVKGEPHKGRDRFTCGLGKFGENQFYAWSGIKRPNKTVAEARRNCKAWTIHPSWRPGDGKPTAKEADSVKDTPQG